MYVHVVMYWQQYCALCFTTSTCSIDLFSSSYTDDSALRYALGSLRGRECAPRGAALGGEVLVRRQCKIHELGGARSWRRAPRFGAGALV